MLHLSPLGLDGACASDTVGESKGTSSTSRRHTVVAEESAHGCAYCGSNCRCNELGLPAQKRLWEARQCCVARPARGQAAAGCLEPDRRRCVLVTVIDVPVVVPAEARPGDREGRTPGARSVRRRARGDADALRRGECAAQAARRSPHDPETAVARRLARRPAREACAAGSERAAGGGRDGARCLSRADGGAHSLAFIPGLGCLWAISLKRLTEPA